jgi:hypothetical protein
VALSQAHPERYLCLPPGGRDSDVHVRQEKETFLNGGIDATILIDAFDYGQSELAHGGGS